jgi:hypothetical protein
MSDRTPAAYPLESSGAWRSVTPTNRLRNRWRPLDSSTWKPVMASWAGPEAPRASGLTAYRVLRNKAAETAATSKPAMIRTMGLMLIEREEIVI